MLTDLAQRNPNAAVALGTGAGLSPLIVWLLPTVGLHVDGPIAALIAGLITTIVLWIGRDGILGIARVILRGTKPTRGL